MQSYAICRTWKYMSGKQSDGPFAVSNKFTDAVNRLISPILGSGRNLTGDNWFSDLDMVEYLRQQKVS